MNEIEYFLLQLTILTMAVCLKQIQHSYQYRDLGKHTTANHIDLKKNDLHRNFGVKLHGNNIATTIMVTIQW